MRYWDSSALVPLLFEESQTAKMVAVLKEDPGIVTWWGSPVECYSALWRRRRTEQLDDPYFYEMVKRYERLEADLDVVPPVNLVRDGAKRLLRFHPLRAGDALQLAAAHFWCDNQPKNVAFVTLDGVLSSAARAEGFTVLP